MASGLSGAAGTCMRSIEVRNLLNAPFCAYALTSFVKGYQTESGPCPFPLTFLALPITLHKETSERLPTTIRTKLHVWLQENPGLRVGFGERATALVPFTREGLMFAMHKGTLQVQETGSLQVGNGISGRPSAEVELLGKRATLVGRLFAHAGTPTTVFSMWGISP